MKIAGLLLIALMILIAVIVYENWKGDRDDPDSGWPL